MADKLNLPPPLGRPRAVREAERARREAGNPGLEIGRGGRNVGRDPRTMGTMTPAELKAMGHKPLSPLKAIRARCIDCCAFQVREVRLCECTECPSWYYRMGTNPHRKKRAPSKARAAQLKAARENRGQDAV